MRAFRGVVLTICGAGLLYPTVASAQQPLVQTKPFAPGQSVRLEVNVGDVRILPNSDGHELRMEIRPNRHETSSSEVQSWVRQFDVSGTQATIRLHMPKTGNHGGDVTLYVPSRTNLSVDLGIGDMTITGIDGNKDISMHIGDLKIGGLQASGYGSVHLSTHIGDLDDGVFSTHESGWLGKSEDVTGKGQYRLNAHIGIGDIRLQTAPASKRNWQTD